MGSSRTHWITVDIDSGGNGAAESEKQVYGDVEAVYIQMVNQGVATPTVVIATQAGSEPSIPILTATNLAASKLFYPRTKVQDTAGADVAASYDRILVPDTYVEVTVSGGDEEPGGIRVALIVRGE